MEPEDIADLLPEVIRRTAQPGTVLDDLLGVMAALHQPVERAAETFDAFVDPYRCPEQFTAYLASWVGLDWLAATDAAATPATGDGPLRHLVAEAAHLAKRRGTAAGLRRMLELATGIAGFSVQAHSDRPFHMTVAGPAAAAGDVDLVRWIIRHEKPAFVTADLVFGDDPPSPVDPAHRVSPGAARFAHGGPGTTGDDGGDPHG